jgi:hypothetical protein
VSTHRGGFAGPAYGIEFTTRRRLPARCPGLVLEKAGASALIRGEEPPQVFRV